MKITGFGDYLIHFSPQNEERFMQAETMRMSFTGAEANVCAALAFWGEDTRFITKLPTHLLAQKGVGFLRGLNIDTKYIAHGEGRMGAYYLEKGSSLRSSVVIYDRAPSAFTESNYDDYEWDKVFEDTDIIYLTGITPSLTDNLFECCKKMLKEAHDRGIKVFFDINYRPTLCSTEKANEIFTSLAPYITHLIGNEEHLKMILGVASSYCEDEPEDRLKDITAQVRNITNIPNIAVTVRRTPSASNAIVFASYSNGTDFALSPRYSIQVVDRVGSGDAFSAGLVYSVIHGSSVKDTVNFAIASNAMKHTILSDINFASVKEITSVMSSRHDVIR